MNDAESTGDAIAIMDYYGIELNPIPRSVLRKTPDFEFSFGCERYTLEMKDRISKWELSLEEIKAFEAGQVVTKQETTGYHASVAARIKKACNQIASHEGASTSLRLVWYFARGLQPAFAAQRILETCYGDVPVVEPSSGKQWPVYFFDQSSFATLGDMLDAALVVRENAPGNFTLHLALNPCSSRFQQIRDSKFASLFPDGVINPDALESTGESLIVDLNADRTNERATLDFLEAKYGLQHLMTLPKGNVLAIAGK